MSRWALVSVLMMAVGCRSGSEPGPAVSASRSPASSRPPASSRSPASSRPPASARVTPTPPRSAPESAPRAAPETRLQTRPPLEKAPTAPVAAEPEAPVALAPKAVAPDADRGLAPQPPETPSSLGAPAVRPNSSVAPAPPPAVPARRVLIVGDSMAATDFGRALERKLDARAQLKVARRGKSSTGLARPDFFDWTREARRQLARHKPDLVVVIIGGNDGQDLIPKGKGRRVHWNKTKWKAAYAARVQSFARLLMGEDRQVAWLELPAMDRRRFERKLTTIRAVQKAALAELGPRVQYISTRAIFYDAKGRLKRKIKARGKRVALRQDDGIHFSLPGSHYFANRVTPLLLEAWALNP